MYVALIVMVKDKTFLRQASLMLRSICQLIFVKHAVNSASVETCINREKYLVLSVRFCSFLANADVSSDQTLLLKQLRILLFFMAFFQADNYLPIGRDRPECDEFL